MTRIQELETRLAALEKEVRTLRDIEAVRAVRVAYWRCAAEQRWSDMTGLFSENAYLDLGFPGMQVRGKKAIVALYDGFRASISAIPSFPRGFNHTIEITGDNTAHAFWLADAPVVDLKNGTVLHIGSIYDEEYLKNDGAWKISSLKIKQTFNESTRLAEAPDVSAK